MSNTWRPTPSKRRTTEEDYVLSGVGTWTDTPQSRHNSQKPDLLDLTTSFSSFAVHPTANEPSPRYLHKVYRQSSVQQDDLRIIQTTSSSSVRTTSTTRSTSRRSTHGSSPSSTSARKEGKSTRRVVIHDRRVKPEYTQLQHWRDETAGSGPWSSAAAIAQPRRIEDARERSYAILPHGAGVPGYSSGPTEQRRRTS